MARHSGGNVRHDKATTVMPRRRASFYIVIMSNNTKDYFFYIGDELGVGLQVAAGERVAGKIDIHARPGNLRRQTVGMARHDDGDDQVAGQLVPQLALVFDKLHCCKLATGVSMGFVFRCINHNHASTLTQGPRDFLVEVVPATELLTINKEFVLVVEVGFQITFERIDQIVLELVHIRVLAVGITEKAGRDG